MKVFTLYIGTERDRNHEVISSGQRKGLLLVVKSRLSDEFGGYSIDEVVGGYKAHDGTLTEERAARIEVTTSDDREQQVREMAKWARDLFKQESVLLNVASVESNFI